MYRILTASKDTYITNKIINNKFRATDANVGVASTLDVFKLFDESSSGSATNPVEISRLLVKFDLSPIRALTASILDINSNSFSATLKLYDIYGGQTTPSNFNIIAFPLSQSFDEGIGRNIVNFTDLDSANFVTASVSNSTPATWFLTGANKQGLLGSDDIDIISSGNLNDGNGVVNLWKSQTFLEGTENLSLDVTNIISATLKSAIPDHGFRISYSGSEETDSVTRFVKRFASRQTSDYLKKPSLVIQYDDSIQDHHLQFFLGMTGSLFLNNDARGSRRNITSGTAATEISGLNCMLLQLTSGANVSGTFFEKTLTASQHRFGDNFTSGIYSATFAVNEFESGTLFNHVQKAHSASFKAIWSSMDKTVGFLTSSFIAHSSYKSSFDNDPKRLLVHVTNLRHVYRKSDKIRFRVFVENIDRPVRAKKLPYATKSEVFTKMYYRIRDAMSSQVVIPFDSTNKSTICSTDSDGMYFDFYMDSLEVGRLYTIDFLICDLGEDMLFTDVAAKFRLEK
tara:strand:- start:966 stop:2504 length:1539 start_codon:yes stop_codon:yes gene_type:complete